MQHSNFDNEKWLLSGFFFQITTADKGTKCRLSYFDWKGHKQCLSDRFPRLRLSELGFWGLISRTITVILSQQKELSVLMTFLFFYFFQTIQICLFNIVLYLLISGKNYDKRSYSVISFSLFFVCQCIEGLTPFYITGYYSFACSQPESYKRCQELILCYKHCLHVL